MGFPTQFLFTLLVASVFESPTLPPHLSKPERPAGVRRGVGAFPLSLLDRPKSGVSGYLRAEGRCPWAPLPTQREFETRFVRQMSILRLKRTK